jgi:hypothetical protein
MESTVPRRCSSWEFKPPPPIGVKITPSSSDLKRHRSLHQMNRRAPLQAVGRVRVPQPVMRSKLGSLRGGFPACVAHSKPFHHLKCFNNPSD